MLKLSGKEGGGQILRTALSLSMLTGKGFCITDIRAGRRKPGLMRQHLTCVKAAAEISGARIQGAEMHSTTLEFQPKSIQAGDYVFKIGTAGSTSLLLQTLLPAFLHAESESFLELHGGTHNPLAPSFDFLQRSFLPQLHKMGANIELHCSRLGFAPAGGGCVHARIQPCAEGLQSVHLLERGAPVQRSVEAILSNVKNRIAEKEIQALQKSLDWEDQCFQVRREDAVDGSGNCLSLEVSYPEHCLHITAHGEFKKSAESVAQSALKNWHMFENSQAVIGVRLADQLLLPLALSGGGSFITNYASNHLITNIKTIEQFMDLDFHLEEEKGKCTVRVRKD